jgi:hypothetical protein
MRIAGRMWRCGHGIAGFSFRRNDVEHDAVIDVDEAFDGVFDVGGRDAEVVVQLGIDEPRIGIVKRKLRETLRAIHRRLAPAH